MSSYIYTMMEPDNASNKILQTTAFEPLDIPS